MIGKHIPPGKIRSKNSYCRAVINYIVRPENSGQEKCAVWGCAHVLMDETPEQVIREMVATASMDISSPNPFVHFVFALAPGEEFDGKQIAVVTHLLKELDAVGLQALWGEHIDTDHRHLHVFINRVDPDTGDLRDINQRYYTKMAHRAAAVLSDAFGFSQPQNALYEVQNGKATRKEKPHADDPRTGISAKPLPAWVYAWEEKHGTEHPWRTGQKVFLDTLTQAATWDDLSVTLLEQGYYIKEIPGKKNAHVLMLPRYEHPIKLSAISRAVSYNNLQRIFDVVSQQAEVLHEPSTITATTPRPFEADPAAVRGHQKLSSQGSPDGEPHAASRSHSEDSRGADAGIPDHIPTGSGGREKGQSGSRRDKAEYCGNMGGHTSNHRTTGTAFGIKEEERQGEAAEMPRPLQEIAAASMAQLIAHHGHRALQKVVQGTLARLEEVRRKAALIPPSVRLPVVTAQNFVPAPLPLPIIAATDMRHFVVAASSARLKRNMGMIASKLRTARQQVRHISRPVTLDAPIFSVQQWGCLEFPAISQAALRRLFQQQATRWAQEKILALRLPLTTIAAQVSALPEPQANTGEGPEEEEGLDAR